MSQDSSQQPQDFGCKHYSRACMLQCPDPICKGKFFICRLCHDENELTCHKLNRHSVTQVKCMRCKKVQGKSRTCTGCLQDFAKYFCDVCSLYTDQAVEKDIHHCNGCGICRVGKDSTYHCDNCGCCLDKAMKDNHECIN